MNGASITVESKKGKGSKFTVIFKKTDKGIKKPHV
jgi:signal transduction histidine kinase